MPNDDRLKALYDEYANWTAREYGAIWGEDGEAEQAGYLCPVPMPQTSFDGPAHRAALLKQLNAIPAEARLRLNE